MDPAPRVLHVDDTDRVREQAADAFADVFPDVTVIHAERGADGLGRLLTGSLDCVVLSDGLPDATGVDVLRSVRNLYSDLPVFLLAADGDEHLASAAIDADVSGYLPLDADAPYERLVNRAHDAIEDYREAHDQRRTKRRIREVYERITDAFVALDHDWRCTMVNSRAETLLDRDGESLRGDRIWHALPGLAGSTFEDALRRAMDDQEPVTFEEYYAPLDVWLEVRAYPDPTGLSVFLRDVSEWKAHEREHRFFERLFESVGSGVVAYTTDGAVQYVNPAYADFVGEDRDAIVGQNRWAFTAERGSETLATDRDELAAGETRHREGRVTTGDDRIPVKVTTTRINVRGTTYHVDTVTDVTEQKRRERELARQNDRLDEFASIVSHDLRNPLSIAQARLGLVAEDRGEDEDEADAEHLETAIDALDRMDALIRDLLELTRTGKTVSDPEPVTLGRVARDAWRHIDAADEALTVDPGVTVLADRDRLQQLLENLFRNAIDHSDPDVSVRVTAEPSGFAVADDGPGIPESERDQVLEPGYTTADDGTGFGLVIVQRIADAHGWTLSVTESEDGGARFEFADVTRPE